MIKLSGDYLNDFIAPSTACIKPKTIRPSASVVAESKLEVERADLIKPSSDLKDADPVSISLNDCLACSGCITSAESVLISAQNYNELMDRLLSMESDERPLIITLSPQTRSSFATKYKLSHLQVVGKMKFLFSRLFPGRRVRIFDSSFGRDLALMHTSLEFFSINNDPSPGLGPNQGLSQRSGPLFTSICPGWICFVEKLHGTLIIPYLSRVKSPQQIMGSLIRKLYPTAFHLSLMPCYDKKLEASRPEYSLTSDDLAVVSDGGNDDVRDVDCVLSSVEIEQMIKDDRFDPGTGISTFADLPEAQEDFNNDCGGVGGDLVKYDPATKTIFGSSGSSSGGYLEYLLGEIVERHPGARIDRVRGRNADYETINVYNNAVTTTTTDQEEPIYSLVKCYGFRNIQNVIRQMKRQSQNKKKKTFDFVEIMACPSGCINGGGQLKPDPSSPVSESLDGEEDVGVKKKTVGPQEMKDFIGRSEQVYRSTTVERPEDNQKLKEILGDLKKDEIDQIVYEDSFKIATDPLASVDSSLNSSSQNINNLNNHSKNEGQISVNW